MSDPDPAPSSDPTAPDCSAPDSSADSSLHADAVPLPAAAAVPPQDQSGPPAAAPATTLNPARFLYIHNPFYLISACLFVYGLKKLFRVGDESVLFSQGSVGYMEPWMLMLSLCAVTLLMAATAVVVVRVGQVWEDARSIVMVVLLMFLAISVSFDELLTVRSDSGNGGTTQSVLMLAATSICFSLGLAEALIRGLRLQLHRSWRLPLYAFLVLFFSYPLLLLPDVVPLARGSVQWLTAAFPLAASGVALALIPAVRRGSWSVRDNGTPWAWPWFPWSPFVMIASAVCFRSYTLTISFDVVPPGSHFWDSTFGIYHLLPFLLAVLVLLLEIGLVERLEGLRNNALAAGLLLIPLAHPRIVPWHHLPSYASFLDQLTWSVASPMYLMLIGLLLFYGWAALRGIRAAEAGAVAMLVLLAVVPARITVDQTARFGLQAGQTWSLFLLAVFQGAVCLRRRTSWSAVISVAAMTAGLSPFTSPAAAALHSPELLLHAVLALWIIIGRLFPDEPGRSMRDLSPPALSLTMIIVSVLLWRRDVPLSIILCYMAGMTLTALCLALLLNDRQWMRLVREHCRTGGVAAGLAGTIQFFRMDLPDGTRPVVFAALSFLGGLLISAAKSGLFPTWKQASGEFTSVNGPQ